MATQQYNKKGVIIDDNSLIEYASKTNQYLETPTKTLIDVANNNLSTHKINNYFNNKIGDTLYNRLHFGIEQPNIGYLPLNQFVTNTISDELVAPLNNDTKPIYNQSTKIRQLVDMFSDIFLHKLIPLDISNKSQYLNIASSNFENWIKTPYVNLNETQKNNLRINFYGTLKRLNNKTNKDDLDFDYVKDLVRILNFYNLKNINWESIDYTNPNDKQFQQIAEIQYATRDENKVYLRDIFNENFLNEASVTLQRMKFFLENLFKDQILLLNNTDFDLTITPFALVNKFNLFALSDNELIDLSYSKNAPTNITTLSLLAKYVYLNEINKNDTFGSLQKITIINPLLNTIYTMDTNRIPKEIYDLVKYEVLGFGYNEESLIRHDHLIELSNIYKSETDPSKKNTYKSYLYPSISKNWLELIKFRINSKYLTKNPYGPLKNAYASGLYLGSKFVNDETLIKEPNKYYPNASYNPSDRDEFYNMLQGQEDLSPSQEEEFFKTAYKK